MTTPTLTNQAFDTCQLKQKLSFQMSEACLLVLVHVMPVIMAADHAEIKEHQKINVDDLIAKTKLTFDEVKKLFKPVKQNIRS